MIRQKVVVVLAFLAGGLLGGIAGRSFDTGTPNRMNASEAPGGRVKSAGIPRESSPGPDQDLRPLRKRGLAISSGADPKIPDHLSFQPDGSVRVPASLTDRIRIRAMDDDWILDPAELAIAGLDENQALELLKLVDEAKASTRERQARTAQVIRQDDKMTLLRIPATKSDEGREEEFAARLDAIVGESGAVIRDSLSNIRFLTNSWGTAEQIVSVETNDDGIREYKVISFAPGQVPKFSDQQLPEAFERDAFAVRRYWGEQVPADLRHLLK
jgi:hypothetical protein